ncbi:MAG: hypothetical protein C5B52_06255 [Bacteroidetes bacterium]|nr:MAG: hypothetical protein C5B52_06255 [Bacteroidota bacterium]
MKSSTGVILKIMNVLAWATYFGLAIKIGSILISYGVSVRNPVAAKNLYMGMNLSSIYQYDFWQYTAAVMMYVLVLMMEAYTVWLLTKVLGRIKISSPFTTEIANRLEKISYVIIATWVVTLITNGHIAWLAKKIPGLPQEMVPGDFLLVAGIVFVFAQIFKKGVELQSENELTV